MKGSDGTNRLATILLLLCLCTFSTCAAAMEQGERDIIAFEQAMSDEYVLVELSDSAPPAPQRSSIAAAATPAAEAAAASPLPPKVAPPQAQKPIAHRTPNAKPASSSPYRGNVAFRLSEKQMREKYNRFLTRNPKRAASLITDQQRQASYEQFKRNRQQIVNRNERHGRVVYKSDGPFADMQRDQFQKRRLNTKNPSRRTPSSISRQVLSDFFGDQEGIRSRILNGNSAQNTAGKSTAVAASPSVTPATSPASPSTVSLPRFASKSRRLRKFSQGVLVEMDAQAPIRPVNIYSKVITYDQKKTYDRTSHKAGLTLRRIAGMTIAGKSGKTGGMNEAGKSGKTGGINDAGKSGKTGGTNALPNGAQSSEYQLSKSTLTSQDVLSHLAFSGVDPSITTELIKTMNVVSPEVAVSSGDERFTSFDTQGSCGSCWAHTASRSIALLRTRSNRVQNPNAALWQPSVQQLLECVHTVDTKGCDGGTPMDALDWMQLHVIAKMDNLGPVTEADRRFNIPPYYPMSNTVGECKLNVTWSTYAGLDNGLVSAGDATHWQSYSSGIFPITDCSPSMAAGNHVVELVGVGRTVDTRVPVWIARNSWSKDWGDNGYIHIPFGVNACGVANFIIEPVQQVPYWGTNLPSYAQNIARTEVIPKPAEFEKLRTQKGLSSMVGFDLVRAAAQWNK